MLTKEQLKDVLGGDDGDFGSGGKQCANGGCKIVVKYPDGSTRDYIGSCGTRVSDGSCICYNAQTQGYPITSNGGVSSCTI
ncbi:hypothetical protein [Elizabethkingia anophelis]|uniref:hypothetical protein n=1 Tax=Elizabethkingia anophelis TaxID=1117645 RepID=UPI003892310E